MFAVGHLALGHICGYATSKMLKTDINLPIILLLSIAPDVDLLILQLQHRGPTHSLISAITVFIPFLIVYKKRAIPYFIALVQHSLIGDLITGGNIQLLWPLNTQSYGIRIGIENPINIILEWIVFTASILIMLKTDHLTTLFTQHNSNLLLLAPISTVLLPTFLNYPLPVPTPLILPHLIYLIIFSTSIIINLSKHPGSTKRALGSDQRVNKIRQQYRSCNNI